MNMWVQYIFIMYSTIHHAHINNNSTIHSSIHKLQYIPISTYITVHSTLHILVGYRQGWAPRSFTFWTHHSFVIFYSTQCSFAFFFRDFGNLWDPKERCVLFLRTWMNAKTATLFCKECKRTREHFILLQKNAEWSVLFSIYINRYI